MKSLKILMGAVLATLVIGTTVWAGPFGPPEPLPDTGKFSLGAGYWSDGTGMKDGDRLGLRSHQYYMQGDYHSSRTGKSTEGSAPRTRRFTTTISGSASPMDPSPTEPSGSRASSTGTATLPSALSLKAVGTATTRG